MNTETVSKETAFVIERQDFNQLFTQLTASGYRVVGPTVRDDVIAYDEISSVEDLPAGWTDKQEGGTYELASRRDAALFGYALGPLSWKKYLFPSSLKLWSARRDGKNFSLSNGETETPKWAFLGVRSCELQAIFIQDRVFMNGFFIDPAYKQRREQAFIIVVQCAVAGKTCFCASMGTGPEAKSGFDLALTEIVEGHKHYFLTETGTEKGLNLLSRVTHREANNAERKTAERIRSHAAEQLRSMKPEDARTLLNQNYEHPHWDELAERCLSCANCTMVCPTCFCSTVEDVTDLKGSEAERIRKWDSCFTLSHSHLHGGSVRTSVKSRYRQWLTHKLATWWDQFGTSGCVGCGRCITWCPVGIDMTEDIRKFSKNITKEKADEKAHA